MDALGRRVERLLYLSAPISFAAFVVLFIALAIDSNEGRFSELCHNKVLAAFEANRAHLETLFPNKAPSPAHHTFSEYRVQVIGILINVSSPAKCYALTREYSSTYSKLSPTQIGDDLRKKIKELKIQRFSYLGSELPEKAAIDVFGTKVLVELQVFITLLQVVLAPVMFLWLGSLLNSRFAEITRIVAITDPTKVYPHVVNTYAGRATFSPRRRGFLQRYWPRFFIVVGPFLHSVGESLHYLIPALIRAFFMGIMVIPPTCALVYSLYLVHIPEYDYIYFAVGVFVAAFGAAPVASEFLPWIYRKSFEYESLRKFSVDRTR